MIVKTYVEKDLRRLNRLYNASLTASSFDDPIYYSKLAVLEFSGWVEESFDVIAERAAKGKLKSEKFRKLLKKSIRDNNGFTYDNNFLPMMAKVVGLAVCEELHTQIDLDGSIAILKSQLDAVLEQRRKAAHVNLANTTISFDAPSVSLGRLNTIYPILRRMYRWFVRR